LLAGVVLVVMRKVYRDQLVWVVAVHEYIVKGGGHSSLHSGAVPAGDTSLLQLLPSLPLTAT
jgi:hypothetical protein